MSNNDEIKKWQTHSVKYTMAFELMADDASFHCDKENGIRSPDYIKKTEAATCKNIRLL